MTRESTFTIRCWKDALSEHHRKPSETVPSSVGLALIANREMCAFDRESSSSGGHVRERERCTIAWIVAN